jgi:cytochrome P450
MTDEQVYDEIVTMFAAGHDTTLNALCWTFYLLSQNPEWDAKVAAEAQTVLGNRIPTFDDHDKFPLVTMCLNEAMRMYPPLWLMHRKVIDTVEIGGYTLRKGDVAYVSQWSIHHHPRYWKDPYPLIRNAFRQNVKPRL